MKAFVVDRYNKKGILRLAEMPAPNVGDSDVLVEVHAAGVNLLDSKLRTGEFKLFLPYRSPTDPRLFFVYELYVDASGWAAHQQTSHFKAFVDEMLSRLARRERIPFVPFATV